MLILDFFRDVKDHFLREAIYFILSDNTVERANRLLDRSLLPGHFCKFLPLDIAVEIPVAMIYNSYS